MRNLNSSPSSAERALHWNAAYREGDVSGLSWFQEDPGISLALIEELGVPPTAAVIDVGGGASVLASELVAKGFLDVTVLDISQSALDLAREHCPPDPVRRVQADLLLWWPDRRFDLWHDRALFHFLVDHDEREGYLAVLRRALEPDGVVILATFAPDGPEFCSGLPVARYAPEELGELLGPDFTVECRRREEHITPAGVRQPFTWLAARRTRTHTNPCT